MHIQLGQHSSSAPVSPCRGRDDFAGDWHHFPPGGLGGSSNARAHITMDTTNVDPMSVAAMSLEHFKSTTTTTYGFEHLKVSALLSHDDKQPFGFPKGPYISRHFYRDQAVSSKKSFGGIFGENREHSQHGQNSMVGVGPLSKQAIEEPA